jgi:hypothetical protein
LQSKSQSKPSAAIAAARVYSQKGAPMKTILLLHDEATRPTQLLQDTVRARLPLRETEAVANCNCDRWGHPCPGCVERVVQPKAELPISTIEKEMRQHMEYLIVFSVLAVMTAYVWILARCLQHA